MRTVLIPALLLFTNFFGIGASQSNAQNTVASKENSRQEAERLWELAISAKGGRGRLYSVDNLQISIREKVWYGLKRVPDIEEDLYVFPNKFWEWSDQRHTIFGFDIRVYNQERGAPLRYIDRGKGGAVAIPMGLPDSRDGLITLYDVQLLYFMETKWVKPIPISVEKGRADGHRVDIVQTIVKGYPTKDGRDEEKIWFALDRQSHLPLQIIYRTVTFGQEYSGGLKLSDYALIDGIEMPLKVSGLRASYKINVSYNERVFEQAPNPEAGIEQWKKK